MQFDGRRVTVMGVGHFGGGAAAARWLAARGARVTLSDSASAEALADSLAALADVPLAAVHFGGHRPEDFQQADWVVVNPAVHPDHPMLEVARQAGARLTTELELFLRACPARVFGVTGSNGKSTTSAMLAAILQADGQAKGRTVWLGGNIGRSLLADLPRIEPDHDVVLEISSFQLHYLADDTPGPFAAVVTNFTPNHLDWHGTLDHYRQSKQRLFRLQRPDGVAVLGESLAADDAWDVHAPARQPETGRHERLVRPCDATIQPAVVEQGRTSRPWHPRIIRVGMNDSTDLPPLRVPGEHNRRNARCAAAVATGAGCSDEAIRRGLADFAGLPGRLEHVAEVDNRVFLNDTTSTTPESTVAALAAMDRPTWLLAGGRDKGLDLPSMAAAAARSVRGAAFFGESASILSRHMAEQTVGDALFVAVNTLSDALNWCWAHSRPGDAILLSPGCASTDQFRHFRHRGEVFEALAHDLKSRKSHS